MLVFNSCLHKFWHLLGFAWVLGTGAIVSVQGLLNAANNGGTWTASDTCHIYNSLSNRETERALNTTCGFALEHVGTAQLSAQALTCDGEPATHGRDFVYATLLRDGLVHTRLLGHHRGEGTYVFPGWHKVRSHACTSVCPCIPRGLSSTAVC